MQQKIQKVMIQGYWYIVLDTSQGEFHSQLELLLGSYD